MGNCLNWYYRQKDYDVEEARKDLAESLEKKETIKVNDVVATLFHQKGDKYRLEFSRELRNYYIANSKLKNQLVITFNNAANVNNVKKGISNNGTNQVKITIRKNNIPISKINGNCFLIINSDSEDFKLEKFEINK